MSRRYGALNSHFLRNIFYFIEFLSVQIKGNHPEQSQENHFEIYLDKAISSTLHTRASQWHFCKKIHTLLYLSIYCCKPNQIESTVTTLITYFHRTIHFTYSLFYLLMQSKLETCRTLIVNTFGILSLYHLSFHTSNYMYF